MTVTSIDLLAMIQSGLNLISQAISIYDRDLRLIHANQRFQTMFMLPDDMVKPGVEFRAVVEYLAERGDYGPLDEVRAFVDEKVQLARAFEPHYFERTRANGTAISVDGCPLDTGGWITVYTDITDIRRAERTARSRADGLSKELLKRSEELEQTNREMAAAVRSLELTQRELIKSRERLELINHMTPAHIAHIDKHGTYTHSNGRLSSIVPSAEKDIVGRPFTEVLGSDVARHVRQSMSRAMQGEATVTELRDEQSGRFIRLAMTPDTRDDGTVDGAYVLSTDVTEEVQARLGLAHERRKALATQLTSAMSHDFSNLLTIIMSQQHRLESAASADPALLEISKTIKSATQRGRELIENLNQIGTERNIDAYAVKAIDVFGTLEQLAKAAVPAPMQVRFSVDIPDKSLVLDPGFIQDALLNLVINAAEACDGPGEVRVSIHVSSRDELEFVVQDNGPGFSEMALKDGLSPFYSTKAGKVNRGLGLTSAFDFARSCGGNLRLQNLAGGGACVTMTIPYLPAGQETPQLILLVDDDNDVRGAISAYLRDAGRSVIEANSVDEAAKLVKIDGLSHVVTDLDLGVSGTGLDIAALVPPEVQTLVMTGLPAADPRRVAASEHYVVLPKPFDFSELDLALTR
jgi:PAS domain S-box-containing protein